MARNQARRLATALAAALLLTYIATTTSGAVHVTRTLPSGWGAGVCSHGTHADLNPKSPTYGTAVCN
ncbi:MAG: hypothetical protein ACYDB4_02845 [Candidatus Dormibacteraceae bacterium]